MSRYINIKDLTEYGKNKCAIEFSEGSKELEMCLKTLWDNNLYTKACCKGHLMGERDFKALYLYGYIAMDENIELFKYLSHYLILDPCVLLYKYNNQEVIYFYGDNKYKNIDLLTYDILSGVKDNIDILLDKVNKPMIPSLKKKLVDEYYLKSGFKNMEIKKLDELTEEYLYLTHLYNDSEILNRKDEILNEKNKIIEKVKRRVFKP